MTHLATNYVPMLLLFPIWLGLGVGLGWWIAKTAGTWRRRCLLSTVSLLALLGSAVLLITLYYALSPTFAGTFRYYALTSLAPDSSPVGSITSSAGDSMISSAIMSVELENTDGVLRLFQHPNPATATSITIFTHGQFTEASIRGDLISVPQTEPGSLQRTTQTSLWWALTKDLNRVASPVESRVE